jgi:glycosyltransferase involved in cell wall biosynthesis
VDAPKVSVLVPAHNHERYVAEALDSVRDAGYPNIEIVLIDDGSTDSTWERVTRWQQANEAIELVASRQMNAGVVRTLNRLLQGARGQYVALLASDDRLMPGGIASRVEFLDNNPRFKAVFADCRRIDAEGNVTAEHQTGAGYPGARLRLLRDPAREIVEHWAVPGPVLMYDRRTILDMGAYDESLIHEDWDMYLRLASRDQIAYLDEIVADYRWHGGNAGADPARAKALAEDFRKVAWRSRRLFRGHLRLELIHETCTWAARVADLRGQRLAWAVWRLASIAVKVVAMAVPRRPSDQAGWLAPAQ